MKLSTISFSTFTVRSVPSGLLIACLAIFLTAFSTPAKAVNLVSNGSFETTSNISSPGGYFCQASTTTCTSNVSGWSSVCRNNQCGGGGTPTSILYNGTNGSGFNNNIGLYSAADSPDGNKYLAADADTSYNSAVFQTINGLTIGAHYTLTFDQAGAQQKGANGATTDQWQVTFGSAPTQLSQVMSVPSNGFSAWTQQTMFFTASATSQVLSFLAVGSPSGLPPVALLDAVSLTSTPEPSTFILAFAALGGLGVYAKRRRSARS